MAVGEQQMKEGRRMWTPMGSFRLNWRNALLAAAALIVLGTIATVVTLTVVIGGGGLLLLLSPILLLFSPILVPTAIFFTIATGVVVTFLAVASLGLGGVILAYRYFTRPRAEEFNRELMEAGRGRAREYGGFSSIEATDALEHARRARLLGADFSKYRTGGLA